MTDHASGSFGYCFKKKMLDINLSKHTPIEIHISISIYLELQDLTIAGFAHIYICTYTFVHIYIYIYSFFIYICILAYIYKYIYTYIYFSSRKTVKTIGGFAMNTLLVFLDLRVFFFCAEELHQNTYQKGTCRIIPASFSG